MARKEEDEVLTGLDPQDWWAEQKILRHRKFEHSRLTGQQYRALNAQQKAARSRAREQRKWEKEHAKRLAFVKAGRYAASLLHRAPTLLELEAVWKCSWKQVVRLFRGRVPKTIKPVPYASLNHRVYRLLGHRPWSRGWSAVCDEFLEEKQHRLAQDERARFREERAEDTGYPF